VYDALSVQGVKVLVSPKRSDRSERRARESGEEPYPYLRCSAKVPCALTLWCMRP